MCKSDSFLWSDGLSNLPADHILETCHCLWYNGRCVLARNWNALNKAEFEIYQFRQRYLLQVVTKATKEWKYRSRHSLFSLWTIYLMNVVSQLKPHFMNRSHSYDRKWCNSLCHQRFRSLFGWCSTRLINCWADNIPWHFSKEVFAVRNKTQF